MIRYHRQSLLPQIGLAGQSRLGSSRVLLIGCGALGTVIADQLARAGVGFLRIVDRDVVELTNLQRQVLFDESDAACEAPKAVAAARRLAGINSSIAIEPRVVDCHAGNILELAGLEKGERPIDVILDGTDNAQTRYLVNDLSVKHGIPWIYGACVGMEGRVMTIRPPETPCLRCLFPQPPAAGELATCDTAGVFAPAAGVVASLQVSAAIGLLVGRDVASQSKLIKFDIWEGRFRTVSTEDARPPECIACGNRHFEFLDSVEGAASTSLCGRNAVQVRPAGNVGLNLEQLSLKLASAGTIERTPHLVRCQLPAPNGFRLTIFPDGRLIVHGTSDLDRARSLYARYIGA